MRSNSGRLRVHLVRQRDELDVGVLLEDQLARAQLVHRVHVRVEEHDRDRRDAERRAGAGSRGARRPRRAACRRRLRRSCRSGISRRTRRRAIGSGAGIRRVPDVLLVAAPQLDLVAEALGDEEPGRRARHLDHRVVAGGRAVHDRRRCAASSSPTRREPAGVGEPRRARRSRRRTGRRASSASSRARPSRRRRSSTRSVNVPPTSTPIRYARHSLDALAAAGIPRPTAARYACELVSRSRTRSVGAELVGGVGVEGEGHVVEGAGDDDAVLVACRLDRHVLVPHVVEDGLRDRGRAGRPTRRHRRSGRRAGRRSPSARPRPSARPSTSRSVPGADHARVGRARRRRRRCPGCR